MIGNECLLGRIATFIETLGLSYDDVVYKIPYRNLVIMQKDKMHPCYGVVVKKMSGKDMMARRIAEMKKKPSVK